MGKVLQGTDEAKETQHGFTEWRIWIVIPRFRLITAGENTTFDEKSALPLLSEWDKSVRLRGSIIGGIVVGGGLGSTFSPLYAVLGAVLGASVGLATSLYDAGKIGIKRND